MATTAFQANAFQTNAFQISTASVVAGSLVNRHPKPWYTEPPAPFREGPRARVVLEDAEVIALAFAAGLPVEYVVALLAAAEEEPIWS